MNDAAKIRSALRDAFIKSPAGERLLDPSILSSPMLLHFLRRRIEAAFFAGLDAGMRGVETGNEGAPVSNEPEPGRQVAAQR